MSKAGTSQFYWGHVSSGDGDALVFINIPTLLALVDSTEIGMDATFYAAPRNYYQLASLHVISYGVVSILYSSTSFICYIYYIIFYFVKVS